jgi:hypothetical protein
MKTDIIKDLGGSSIFISVDVDTSSSQGGSSGGDDDDDGVDGAADRFSSVGFDSHRINDGATVLSNTESGALSYYRASRNAANCAHVPFGPSPLLATVTTRKVQRGEELLTTYGCSCTFLMLYCAIAGQCIKYYVRAIYFYRTRAHLP